MAVQPCMKWIPIKKDGFHNIQYQSESGHLITLHYLAHPVQRSDNDNKLTSICSDLNAVKNIIINNLQKNVANQSRTVYCWICFSIWS